MYANVQRYASSELNSDGNDSPLGYSGSDRSCPIIDDLLGRDRSAALLGISGIAMEDFTNRYLYAEDFEYLDRILWESTRQPCDRQGDVRRGGVPSNARHERLRAYLQFRVRPPKKRVPPNPPETHRYFTNRAKLRFAMLLIVIFYVCFAISYGLYEEFVEHKHNEGNASLIG